jgi:plastocyanin
MRKNYLVILPLAVIILLAGFFLWRSLKNTKKSSQAEPMNTVLAKEVVVTLDSNGFSPKTVTIKPGIAVKWKNVTDKPQTVNSDNYPTNQLHKELNFGVFNGGSSVMYIFTKPGTYGYHNQFHQEQTGTITVSP